MRCYSNPLRIGLAVLLMAALLMDWGTIATTADTLPPGVTSFFPSPNERFGFGVLYGIDNYDVLPLNAGWYQNWGLAAGASHPGSILAAHVVRVSPEGFLLDLREIERIADEDPGGLWLIGNEPDMSAQDNVTPTQYATQYRQAYFAIKAYDPTAQVAAGGIVQPTPLRLGWLSAVLDAYKNLYGGPMPADVWNIHNYILQEVPGEWGCGIPPGYYGERPATYPYNSHDDLTIFQDHVLAMRQWMADHGQWNKPLIISEYGILFPESTGFDLTRVSNFFINTANWMLTATDPALGYPADGNHLVQRWMWYSLDDTNFNNSGNTIAGLMDPATRQLQAMGQVFADQVTPLRRPYVNLVAARVRLQADDGGVTAADATQPVVVQATIQNRGNTAFTQPFRVVIQDQEGRQIHAETINGMSAHYGGNIVVQATWQMPAETNWKVTVLIDSENTVGESNEDDNRLVFSPAADLQITSFTITDENGRDLSAQATGRNYTLTASIDNLEGVLVTGTVLRFWNGTQLLHQKTLPELAPGAHTDALFVWEAPGTGAYELAADLMMPSGISDPVEENNRIGRQIVIASTYRYLPVINGPQFQSGATAGVQCSNKLLNSGFEAGTLANWSVSPFVGLMNAGCQAGSYCAWLGRGWNIEDDLYQTVSIKPWASAHLTYGWAVVTAERAAEQRDTLTVEVRSAEGQLLRTIETLGNQDAHPYWYTSSFDLSEFVGQTVQIRFHAHNDGADVTNFFLDEIILEVCERSQ